MTESEEDNNEQGTTEESEEEEEEKNMFRKRVVTSFILIGGVAAGLISNYTVGFSSLIGVTPVIPMALLTLAVIKFNFEDFSKKTVAFVFFLTFFVWFIFGTFVLQI